MAPAAQYDKDQAVRRGARLREKTHADKVYQRMFACPPHWAPRYQDADKGIPALCPRYLPGGATPQSPKQSMRMIGWDDECRQPDPAPPMENDWDPSQPCTACNKARNKKGQMQCMQCRTHRDFNKLLGVPRHWSPRNEKAAESPERPSPHEKCSPPTQLSRSPWTMSTQCLEDGGTLALWTQPHSTSAAPLTKGGRSLLHEQYGARGSDTAWANRTTPWAEQWEPPEGRPFFVQMAIKKPR